MMSPDNTQAGNIIRIEKVILRNIHIYYMHVNKFYTITVHS